VRNLINWIQRHQVAAFFIVTFLITWGLGFSYSAVMRQGKDLLVPLASVATCGPALAGIIVSTVCNTEPKSGTSRAPRIAFVAALVLVTVVFLANNTVINHAPLSPVMVGFTLVAVTPPVAYVISATYSRVPAVRRYLASLVNRRGAIGWSLLALVLVPGLGLLSIVISGWLGRQPTAPTSLPAAGLSLVGMIAIKFLYQFFFFNCIGEEVGWRGFALPRLQARINPLIASLVMTLFWAIWHLFLWYGEGQPIFTIQYWIDTFVKLIPPSVIFGWFYNRSKASILVAGIVHAGANTAFAFLPNLDWPVYTLTLYAAILVIIIIDRMWQKLPADHPAVVQSLELDI